MPTLSNLSREMPSEDELADFPNIIDREVSDRAAALMSASLVEHALYTSAVCRMADCGETARNTWFHDANSPFGTFAAKIKLGRALGIYGPEMERRLEKVKNIRNVFAHRASPIDFNHPRLVKEVADLSPLKNDSAKTRYCAVCLALARLLIDDSFKNGGKVLTVSYP